MTSALVQATSVSQLITPESFYSASACPLQARLLTAVREKTARASQGKGV